MHEKAFTRSHQRKPLVSAPVAPPQSDASAAAAAAVSNSEASFSVDLLNGEKVNLKMSLTATIQDLRAQLDGAHPVPVGVTYKLQLAAPPRSVLDDPTQTIAAAQLDKVRIKQVNDAPPIMAAYSGLHKEGQKYHHFAAPAASASKPDPNVPRFATLHTLQPAPSTTSGGSSGVSEPLLMIWTLVRRGCCCRFICVCALYVCGSGVFEMWSVEAVFDDQMCASTPLWTIARPLGCRLLAFFPNSLLIAPVGLCLVFCRS